MGLHASSKAVLDKMKMRHAHLFPQNLFTITSYTGADPEGLLYPYPFIALYVLFGIIIWFQNFKTIPLKLETFIYAWRPTLTASCNEDRFRFEAPG